MPPEISASQGQSLGHTCVHPDISVPSAHDPSVTMFYTPDIGSSPRLIVHDPLGLSHLNALVHTCSHPLVVSICMNHLL